MKKIIFITFMSLLLFIPSVTFADEDKEGFIVTYQEQQSKVSTADDQKQNKTNRRTEFLSYDSQATKNKLLQQLKKDKSVLTIEENRIRTTTGTITPMNDPLYQQQWWIQASYFEQAWALQKKSKPIVVAVIDSGVDHYHEDLLNRVSHRGYDFYNESPQVIDENGHGTSVAGLIAAEANNKTGIVGASGRAPVQVLPIRVTDSEGKGYVSDIIKAIEYAIEQQVDIINISMSSKYPVQAERQFIQQAVDAGIVVIASAGNDALKGNPISYPAAYPEVISVGALTQKMELADFSSTNHAVNLTAPGHRVATTGLNNSYVYASGTSFAAPVVTGVIALLKSEFPKATVTQLREAIEKTAIDLGKPGKDFRYGEGAVHAEKAMLYLQKKLMSPEESKVNPLQTQPPYSFQMEVDYLKKLGVTIKNGEHHFDMTRENFIIALAEVMQLEPVYQTISFSDVPQNSKLALYLNEMTQLGIIQGYHDGTFRPQNHLTRGHAALILSRAFNLQDTREDFYFSDLPKQHTYYPSVLKLAQHRITTGYHDGTFKPNHTLSSRHAFTFLSRAHRYSMD